MLYLTSETKIFLATKPVDFRRQIDGLMALCEQQLGQNTRTGDLFVFINRARTMIRVLCYEGNGYWLATKRLSRGRYSAWPSTTLTATQGLHASELTRILKEYVAPKRRSV